MKRNFPKEVKLRQEASDKFADKKYNESIDLYMQLANMSNDPRDFFNLSIAESRNAMQLFLNEWVKEQLEILIDEAETNQNYERAAWLYEEAKKISDSPKDYRGWARNYSAVQNQTDPNSKSKIIVSSQEAAKLSGLALDWIMAGEYAESFSKYKTAAYCYNKAAEISNDSKDWKNAAKNYEKRREDYAAAFCYEKAAKINDNVDDWLAAAKNYEKKEKYHEAAYCYERAAKINHDVSNWLAAAANYERMSKHREAAFCYEEAATISERSSDWIKAKDCYENCLQDTKYNKSIQERLLYKKEYCAEQSLDCKNNKSTYSTLGKKFCISGKETKKSSKEDSSKEFSDHYKKRKLNSLQLDTQNLAGNQTKKQKGYSEEDKHENSTQIIY